MVAYILSKKSANKSLYAVKISNWFKKYKSHLTEKAENCLIRGIGVIAQSVEQRIENPCVPSSSLGLATIFKIYFKISIPDQIRDFFWLKNMRLNKKMLNYID